MKRIFIKYGVTMGLVVALFLAAAAQQDSKPYQPQQSQQGQGGNSRAEKIEALKVAFITQQLNLTPEEAQKFWPIYNSYKADLATLRKGYGLDRGVQLNADQKIDFEQKKLDLQKKYLPQVETAIGKDKAATLYSLDEKFRKRLEELQRERQQQRTRQWNNNGY